MDPLRMPPMPADYESAIKELTRLIKTLHKERTLLVKQIEGRQLDNRANKGNIRILKEENKQLRDQLAQAEETIKNMALEASRGRTQTNPDGWLIFSGWPESR